MEFIKEETVNGRKITYVKYTEDEKEAIKKKIQELKKKKVS